MKRMLLPAIFAFAVGHAVACAQTLPELSQKLPFLKERLASSRWQVRYALVPEADASEDGRRLLEALINDENISVANQAQVRYLSLCLKVDRKLFRPDAYLSGHVSFATLSRQDACRTLLDYYLGRKDDPRFHNQGESGSVPVLDPAQRDNPRLVEAITVVGVLGDPADAAKLTPFLESANDYVAVNAARALARLGETDQAAAGLARILKQEPETHLYYLTQALRLLRDMQSPQFKPAVDQVLKAVGKKEIQPNWLNEFLLLAAEVNLEALK